MTSRVRKGAGGRKPSVSDAEIIALHDQGLNQREIAEHFSRSGRPMTQAGINYRLRQIKEGLPEHDPILPRSWKVRAAHGTGWVYIAAVAYAKWRRGRGLSTRELGMARRLEAKLDEMNAVLTYDRERGFMTRDRRDSDPGLLV